MMPLHTWPLASQVEDRIAELRLDAEPAVKLLERGDKLLTVAAPDRFDG